MCVWGGGGGVLSYFLYISRLRPFLCSTIRISHFSGYQKNEYFLGYEDFVDSFWGSSKNWTIFKGHFYAF